MAPKTKTKCDREADCADSPSAPGPHHPTNCPLCSKTFFSVSTMKRHISTHTKEKPYKCKLCDYTGVSGSIRMHTKRNHEYSTTKKMNSCFKCPDCDFGTNVKGDYNQHRLLSHLAKPIKCEHPGCGFKSRRKYVLKRHQLSHTRTSNFACDFPGCGYSSQYKYTLARHKKLVHVKQEKFPCPIPGCSYSATMKSKLPSHVQRIHKADKQKKVSCPEKGCHFKSKHGKALNDHLYEHRKNRILQCPFEGCKAHARSKVTLMYHMRLHDPTREFTCALCHLKFESYKNLSTHIKNHTKEQPFIKFKCGECGEHCKDLRNVSRHVEIKHPDMLEGCEVSINKAEVPDTNTKRFRCSIDRCSFQVSSLQDLETHRDVSHSHRMFLCRREDCHFRAHLEEELKTHQLKHDETLRPFKCPKCPFRTGRKSYVEEHLARQHSSIKWTCKFCQSNIFSSKMVLQRHVARSHVAQAI